jgi:hypothetical protein
MTGAAPVTSLYAGSFPSLLVEKFGHSNSPLEIVNRGRLSLSQNGRLFGSGKLLSTECFTKVGKLNLKMVARKQQSKSVKLTVQLLLVV